jgi:hypothetical protein
MGDAMTPNDSPSREAQLAAEPLDQTDVALLNAIRAYYDETDPVPEGLVERIKFELTLDALEAEVATLIHLEPATSGVRSGQTEAVRTVTFTSESVTTTVAIAPQGRDRVRVDGWAAPGAGIRVEVLLADSSRETVADDVGRFVFRDLPAGLAKFALHIPKDEGSATVLTPTIEL